MTAVTAPREARARQSARTTVRRGLHLSPELRRGLPGTLVLALIATAGRVVVPIAIQQSPARTVPRMKRRSQVGASAGPGLASMYALYMRYRPTQTSETATNQAKSAGRARSSHRIAPWMNTTSSVAR